LRQAIEAPYELLSLYLTPMSLVSSNAWVIGSYLFCRQNIGNLA
jgi:hypothetical protein